MDFWWIIIGVLLLVFVVIAVVVIIKISKYTTVCMREGRRIQVEVGINYAKLLIDGKVENETKAFIKSKVELSAAVDDMTIKAEVSTGMFRPIVKIFINGEYVDQNDK